MKIVGAWAELTVVVHLTPQHAHVGFTLGVLLGFIRLVMIGWFRSISFEIT